MEIGPLIGRGRTAKVYVYGNGKIIKHFYDWYKPEWIRREFEVNTKVAATGLPVPVPYEIVVIDGLEGIVYDRVDGQVLLRKIMEKPWTMLTASRLLAEEQFKIHKCSVPGLPMQKERLIRQISGLNINHKHKEHLLRELASLPDGNMLCHGDFHPDNVIMTNSGPVIIDWNNATSGNPLADVAQTCMLLTMGEVIAPGAIKWLLGLIRKRAHQVYLRRYIELANVRPEDIEQWTVPVMAARLAEASESERAQLVARLREYGVEL